MEILQVNMALPVQDNKNNDCNQIIDHGDKTKCPYKIFQPYISCCFKKKILPVGNKRTQLPQNKAFPGIGP